MDQRFSDPIKAITVIDAHHDVWRLTRRPQPWTDTLNVEKERLVVGAQYLPDDRYFVQDGPAPRSHCRANVRDCLPRRLPARRVTLRQVARQPRMARKLSCLVKEARHVDPTAEGSWTYTNTSQEAFASDRLMYGSAWPVCTLRDSLAELIQSVPTHQRPHVE